MYVLWLMLCNICFMNLTCWWDFCSAFSCAPTGTFFFLMIHILLHRSLWFYMALGHSNSRCTWGRGGGWGTGNAYKNVESLNISWGKYVKIQLSVGLPQVREKTGKCFQGQEKDRNFTVGEVINYLLPMLHMQNYIFIFLPLLLLIILDFVISFSPVTFFMYVFLYYSSLPMDFLNFDFVNQPI